MQPYFRDAVPGDLPAIGTILRGASFDGERIAPDALRATLADIERDDHNYVLVAEYDVQIVAVLQFMAFPELHRGGRTAEIVSLEVAVPFRTSGIGSMLLDHAIDRCCDLGCRWMQVRSSTVRRDEHPFWERAGFIHLERGYARPLDRSLSIHG
jgi:GNAT superfamily N-acetyltransferase